MSLKLKLQKLEQLPDFTIGLTQMRSTRRKKIGITLLLLKAFVLFAHMSYAL
jgi:hypothetical protein